MPEALTIEVEPTPNPNSLKFSLNRQIEEGRGKWYESPEEASAEPLAQKLFALGGMKSLFFCGNFISVGREQTARWEELVPKVRATIEEHFSTG